MPRVGFFSPHTKHWKKVVQNWLVWDGFDTSVSKSELFFPFGCTDSHATRQVFRMGRGKKTPKGGKRCVCSRNTRLRQKCEFNSNLFDLRQCPLKKKIKYTPSSALTYLSVRQMSFLFSSPEEFGLLTCAYSTQAPGGPRPSQELA